MASRTDTRHARRTPRPAASRHLSLFALVVLLDVIGLVMVLSSSSVEALRAYGSSWVFFERQLLWVVVGLAAMAVALRVDYRRWRSLNGPLLAVSVGLLFLVLVPGMGITVNGSARWLGAGQFRIQPSEVAKLALLVFTAALLSKRADRVDDPRATTWPVLAVLVVVALLILRQPDMGTALVIGCMVMIQLFVAGTPVVTMGKLLLSSAGLALVAGMAEPYRRDRLLAFLHPWKDPGNTGYQSIQGLVGLATGGVFGVGLGASRAKWGFLPNAHTDFIFAIIGEELGLVGSLAVVALFVVFAILGVRAAARAPDRFGMLLASGITAWIVVQAFVNIGAVAGVLPITGVPLPFVSFGGSSLVVLMFGAGILLNVAKQGRPVEAGRRRSRPVEAGRRRSRPVARAR